MNLTCNATLEEMRILPGSEKIIVGALTFHQLALIIAAGSTLIAILMSFFLIWMHALNYTKPHEQKHIIRILFMIPVYATASFLSLRFYWHAIYFQVLSDCYEAFAISSFFALMCHYMAPDLHEQKEFFRDMRPIKPWVWPLNWFRACCGGERGIWRTPKSGLTWFNIVWIGIYHYCFIRVAMTITAVVTQYFDRYCESSNNPVFGHIWVIAINCIAVTIAMYCVIQFYVQLKEPLKEHKPFLKVLAIKLVIFLSFWQATAISVGTSTLDIVHANEVIAYPDLKVGIPMMLLCFEMACFSILHIWAFPYGPYVPGAPQTFYPVADPDSGLSPKLNEHEKPSGGFMGFRAIWDALNVWDIVKAFGRGIRWLFVGVRHRHEDISYRTAPNKAGVDMDDLSHKNGRLHADTAYGGANGGKSTDHLPIATEFRRSRFDELYGGQETGVTGGGGSRPGAHPEDEAEGLIAHAQPMSGRRDQRSQDPSPYREPDYSEDTRPYGRDDEHTSAPAPYRGAGQEQPYDMPEHDDRYVAYGGYSGPAGHPHQQRPNPRNSTQLKVGQALWGAPGGGSGSGSGSGRGNDI